MKSIEKVMRRFVLGVALVGVPLIGGCGDNMLTWTEDVQLLDGRVITVTQKRRVQERIEREAWMTLKLPEFGDQEITWHENLDTMIVNVHQGQLYVVGNFPSEKEIRQYGWPTPAYIGFRYDNGQWMRIPFSEIPTAIYDANMFPDNMVLYRLKHVSLAEKIKIFQEGGWRSHQRRIDPNHGPNP